MTQTQYEIFEGLDDNERSLFFELCEKVSFKSHEVLLFDGQPSEDLYLIDSGRVDISKSNEKGGQGFVIANLSAGQIFGDMSFLDGRPVSATVTANGDVEVFVLSCAVIEKDTRAAGIYAHILRHIAMVNTDRLRSQNTAHVQALEIQMENMKLRNEAARFLILVVIVFGIQNFAGILIRGGGVDANNPYFEWGMLLMFLIPSYVCARRFGYSPASLGLNLNNWEQSLKEALLVIPFLIVGAIGFKWLAIQFDFVDPELPFFSTNVIEQRPFEIVAYLFHVGLQELGSRGIFQGSLTRFLGREKGKLAVLVISLMFAILHLHMDLTFVVVVFFGSLVFGSIYLRQGNLIGVTVVHYAIGMLMQFLGFMQ